MLRAAGADVTDVAIAHASSTPAVYIHIHSSEGATYRARTLDTLADRYTPVVRRRLELGRYVLAEDYVRAMEGRELLRREVDAALAGCDALILPTLPIPAPPIGAESVIVNGAAEPVRALMLRLTQLFNVTGHPAISIPCGTTSEGLPVGVQIVGHRNQTAALLQLALACEARICGAICALTQSGAIAASGRCDPADTGRCDRGICPVRSQLDPRTLALIAPFALTAQSRSHRRAKRDRTDHRSEIAPTVDGAIQRQYRWHLFSARLGCRRAREDRQIDVARRLGRVVYALRGLDVVRRLREKDVRHERLRDSDRRAGTASTAPAP